MDEFITSISDFNFIFEKLRRFTAIPDQKVVLNFKLWEDDSDAKTSRFFLELMNLMEDYQYNKGGEVVINWCYPSDNEDLAETGREFAEDVKLKFNLIPC